MLVQCGMTGIKFSPRYILGDLSTKFEQRLIFAAVAIYILVDVHVVRLVGLCGPYLSFPQELVSLFNASDKVAISQVVHGSIAIESNLLGLEGVVHDVAKYVEASTLLVGQDIALHVIEDLAVEVAVIH